MMLALPSPTSVSSPAVPLMAAASIEMLKVTGVARLPASVAVTRTASVPTSPDAGVPENVRVSASNVSHPGRGEPSERVAV